MGRREIGQWAGEKSVRGQAQHAPFCIGLGFSIYPYQLLTEKVSATGAALAVGVQK